MKVAIGGSRKLPDGTAKRVLADFIENIGKDVLIMVRSPMSRPPGAFEDQTAVMAITKGLKVEYRRPKPTDAHPGRASVYLRDYDMVQDADLVVLFFTPDDAVSGYSGTAHLLDKALDAGVPVTAWMVYEDGSVVRIGEVEPE
jgi:hypothetical protein